MADTPASARFGGVARLLHWTTVVALVAQFSVGYLLEIDGRGRGRGRGRGGESGRGRGRGRGGDALDALGDDGLLTAHVVLGVTILALAAVRLWWRVHHGLPPWAPTLTRRGRLVAHWTELTLYGLLFAVPASGLWVLFVSDDAIGLHVASHIAFFVVVALHIGFVLKHQLIDRDDLLRRML